MEQALKVTNVMSDPTRYNIYQYMIKHHRNVSAAEIAKAFEIHTNVARLHLSKLEDVHMVESYSEKTGKGGRPSRRYHISDEVIELNFPYRDYKLLSSIAIESFTELGEAGQQALYNTGKKYGTNIINRDKQGHTSIELTTEQKLYILEDAGDMLGMYPEFHFNEAQNTITFTIKNCPFKEIALNNQATICHMHHAFLKGMLEALFEDIQLLETENMFEGCENCSYLAKLATV
ncbi:helix-turn-helix domain-containing protein [Lentibacillus cibarius]|uniref:Helix-turn-helix domain-containing protein n=1 Tax=Lentibacillus cibarius TaxID=2583219 RepID=A0A549YN44_9BACI|nr:helix-turn-helix domain-containing protein [Lentibacillus cibarius]TRM13290.1 helix-turn-helix domain-containing protein [Lentibacillus cibarius]